MLFDQYSASSGQTSGGMFGGGGGMFSGLGGKPSEDKAKTNVFGSVPTFGSTAATQGKKMILKIHKQANIRLLNWPLQLDKKCYVPDKIYICSMHVKKILKYCGIIKKPTLKCFPVYQPQG